MCGVVADGSFARAAQRTKKHPGFFSFRLVRAVRASVQTRDWFDTQRKGGNQRRENFQWVSNDTNDDQKEQNIALHLPQRSMVDISG